MSRYWIQSVALALAGCIAAPVVADPDPLDTLRAAYPGVQVVEPAPNMRAIYGTPMTAGADPVAAAEAFIEQHRDALGGMQTDLILDWTCDVNFGKFTVLNYRQEVGGLPVEYGQATVLVHNGLNRVVFASGTLADVPAGWAGGDGFIPGVDPGEAADAIVQMPAFRHKNLTRWYEPELVVFFGEHTKGASRITWRISGENPDPVSYDAYSFFVDAATGQLVHTRREVHSVDVVGDVQGMATPGMLPDTPSNPPVAMPISGQQVNRTGGGNAFTGPDGTFVIPYAGTGSVAVSADLDIHRWIDINDLSGTEVLSASAAGTAGVPLSLLFNPTPTEFTTAQVNVARVVGLTHDHVTDRAPGYTALTKITGNVNLDDSCNATYLNLNQSITFRRKNGNCNNTAYSDTISHEYGHYMVNRRGLAQGAFGEGFGDSLASMIFNNYEQGAEFVIGQPYIRNPLVSNVQYPCVDPDDPQSPGEIHYCGMVVSGVWWRIKTAFENKYGESLGFELARQLHIDWYLITAGGVATNGMHPMSAVEILTLNDDDGDLATGTPDLIEICGAFAAHNIDCPDLGPITFAYPDSLPELVTPGQPTAISVNVGSLESFPVAGTGKVHWSVNGGPFQAADMTQNEPNEYTATLPVFGCGDAVAFYFSASSDAGDASHPRAAPAQFHSTLAAYGTVSVLGDDFETDKGWLVSGTTQNGRWQRGVPVNDPAWQYAPAADADGSGQCYLTENAPGNTDVDNGTVHLYSPALDLSPGGVTISFWYYISQTTPGMNDFLRVQISSNGFVGPWKDLAAFNQHNGNEWTRHRVTQADLIARGIAAGSNMMLRFSVNDDSPQSIIEAGIDGVLVEVADCESQPCYADCDASSALDFFDILCFLNEFNAGAPEADCDASTTLDFFDVLCFLNAFNAGCP